MIDTDNKNKDSKNRNMRKKLLKDLNELYGIYNWNYNLSTILINIYIDNFDC